MSCVPHSGSALATLGEFWQQLPRATWGAANATFSLVDGTYFLGESSLGRDLFYRPEWYPVLEARIASHFDSGGQGIVILGNPGRWWGRLYLVGIAPCCPITHVSLRRSHPLLTRIVSAPCCTRPPPTPHCNTFSPPCTLQVSARACWGICCCTGGHARADALCCARPGCWMVRHCCCVQMEFSS